MIKTEVHAHRLLQGTTGFVRTFAAIAHHLNEAGYPDAEAATLNDVELCTDIRAAINRAGSPRLRSARARQEP